MFINFSIQCFYFSFGFKCSHQIFLSTYYVSGTHGLHSDDSVFLEPLETWNIQKSTKGRIIIPINIPNPEILLPGSILPIHECASVTRFSPFLQC